MNDQTLSIEFPDGETSGFLAMSCKEIALRLSFASQALTEAIWFQMVRGGPTILMKSNADR